MKFSTKHLLLSATLMATFLGSVSVAIAQVKTVKITDSIYAITGKGGNIGVFIGADGTFMIDDKFADMSESIMQAVTSIGGENPRFLINTHYHGDHTGGNENFGKLKATIVAHHKVYQRLAEGTRIAAFNAETPPAAEKALPVITFDSEIMFHINGDHVRVIYVDPAHTDGDSFVHFQQENVIHSGDLFFNGFYPFIDIENGGSVQGVIDAAEKILELSNENTQIIPGHGPMATRADLQAYRDMLIQARERLSPLKASGLSAEDAALENPLSELAEQWGDGLFTTEKWISLIYDDLG